VDAAPDLTTIGTLSPVGASFGTRTLIWNTPATMPGAAPAYSTSPLTPPVGTVTRDARLAGVPEVNWPSRYRRPFRTASECRRARQEGRPN
jgi:hypothetical protein